MNKQPWIYNKFFDGIFILSPPFIALAIALLIPESSEMNIIWWVVLILCIDVSHVYSTLYRTYFDKNIMRKHSHLLKLIPILCLGIGIILYSANAIYFWRMLAYVAVFHFIRQQYGFIRLYSKDNNKINNWIDSICIYSATLFPIIYWHLIGQRKFNWFVESDFLYLNNLQFKFYFYTIYLSIVLVYLVKEVLIYYRTHQLNIPKNAVMIGTLVSWYFGIIFFNSDIIFTLLNVVAHGIPYMALVWVWGRKMSKTLKPSHSWYYSIFSMKGIGIFIGIILILAYIEEGLWDAFVWNENANLFGPFDYISKYNFSDQFYWLIPLLSLPQLTHYVLDGFIWKIKHDDFEWSELVLSKTKS